MVIYETDAFSLSSPFFLTLQPSDKIGLMSVALPGSPPQYQDRQGTVKEVLWNLLLCNLVLQAGWICWFGFGWKLHSECGQSQT